MANDDREMKTLKLRVTPEIKRIIERAASCESKTIGGFIRDAALTHAKATVREHQFFTLSFEDSDKFLSALDRPVQFNDYLKSAIKEHDEIVDCK